MSLYYITIKGWKKKTLFCYLSSQAPFSGWCIARLLTGAYIANPVKSAKKNTIIHPNRWGTWGDSRTTCLLPASATVHIMIPLVAQVFPSYPVNFPPKSPPGWQSWILQPQFTPKIFIRIPPSGLGDTQGTSPYPTFGKRKTIDLCLFFQRLYNLKTPSQLMSDSASPAPSFTFSQVKGKRLWM